jgi:transcriptional regulator
VPTWNYVADEARSTFTPVIDGAALQGLVRRLAEAQETGRDHPGAVEYAPENFIAGIMKAIMCFRMMVTSLDGSATLWQHRPDADRARVRDGMAAQPTAAAQAIAALMRG